MIISGNALHLPIKDSTVQCCVTSPPYYGLRDYGVADQIGLEPTPDEYVAKLVAVFREVKRVLKDDGVLWLNIGDSYFSKPKSNYNGKAPGLQSKNYGTGDTTLGYKQSAEKYLANKQNGMKDKDLIGIPWMVAFALRADGWYLRSDIIWHKPNPMPESVKDRPTKAHEYVFLLAKSARYYYDAEAVMEESADSRVGSIQPVYNDKITQDTGRIKHETRVGLMREREYKNTRNKRSVWTITTQPFKGAHFAVMPEKLVEPCVLAGSRPGDVILDPFAGSGTVGVVAQKFGRQFIGIELNPEYVKLAEKRLIATPQSLFNVSILEEA